MAFFSSPSDDSGRTQAWIQAMSALGNRALQEKMHRDRRRDAIRQALLQGGVSAVGAAASGMADRFIVRPFMEEKAMERTQYAQDAETNRAEGKFQTDANISAFEEEGKNKRTAYEQAALDARNTADNDAKDPFLTPEERDLASRELGLFEEYETDEESGEAPVYKQGEDGRYSYFRPKKMGTRSLLPEGMRQSGLKTVRESLEGRAEIGYKAALADEARARPGQRDRELDINEFSARSGAETAGERLTLDQWKAREESRQFERKQGESERTNRVDEYLRSVGMNDARSKALVEGALKALDPVNQVFSDDDESAEGKRNVLRGEALGGLDKMRGDTPPPPPMQSQAARFASSLPPEMRAGLQQVFMRIQDPKDQLFLSQIAQGLMPADPLRVRGIFMRYNIDPRLMDLFVGGNQ